MKKGSIGNTSADNYNRCLERSSGSTKAIRSPFVTILIDRRYPLSDADDPAKISVDCWVNTTHSRNVHGLTLFSECDIFVKTAQVRIWSWKMFCVCQNNMCQNQTINLVPSLDNQPHYPSMKLSIKHVAVFCVYVMRLKWCVCIRTQFIISYVI